MLDKDFDMVVVGKSYLSFLFSLELLGQKQRVLILDDKRLQYGDLYKDGIGPIELHFLKTWGRDRKIGPLLNIEKYLTERPITFCANKHFLKLGRKASNNLLELFRCMPFLFNDVADQILPLFEVKEYREEFDWAFGELSQRLGQNAFRYKSVSNFNLDFFLNQSPTVISLAFRGMQRSLERVDESVGHKDFDQMKLLSFLTKAFFLKRLSLKEAPHELFYIFMNLLGPHYSIDQELLEKDLGDYFVEKGGQFKKTDIREWQFHRGRPWCLELASFEGIIHPQKMAIMGGAPEGLPLSFGETSHCYEALIIENTISVEQAQWLPDGPFIYGTQEAMGTSYPLWIMRRDGSLGDKVKLKFFFLSSYRKGSKVEFDRNIIISKLKDDFREVFPWASETLGHWSLRKGPEIYISEERDIKKDNLPLLKNIKIFDYCGPGKLNQLKNVYYFGPFREAPLGLLSGLMEMKEAHHYL